MRILWRRWRDPLKKFAEDAEDGSHGGTGPCLVGPMGVVPLSESQYPSDLFNFWMGHTDFHIDEAVKEGIMAVPGVESIDVFTPYRFRMAVGKAFKSREVRGWVERALGAGPAGGRARGMDAVCGLLGRGPYWAVCRLADGTVEAFSAPTAAALEERVGPLRASAEVRQSW